jgi:hypothetical protein
MGPLQLYQENLAKESRTFLLLLPDFPDCRPITLRLHLKEKVRRAKKGK